ncbi:MAG TPA: BON domain-containing protein [Paraburkholderia sp.]|jgi:hypothetical protein
MKSVDFLKALGLAACLTVAGGAYAQNDAGTSGNADTGAATPASPAHAHHMMHHETSAARMANRKLATAVRRALSKTQGVDATNVIVRARNGDITLLGTVSDPTQIDKAGQAAQGVDGVNSVTNKLALRHD